MAGVLPVVSDIPGNRYALGNENESGILVQLLIFMPNLLIERVKPTNLA